MVHTKGPWIAMNNELEQPVFIYRKQDGEDAKEIAILTHREKHENARLIAAAPDLLAFLKKLAEHGDRPEDNPLAAELHALIAKVEGGNSKG